MTWKEIDQLDRGIVIVIPFGAVEQHGLHLPLHTDALIGTSIARRLDQACNGSLLVLPTQWLGLSTHHMRFPGTLTLSPDTFITMATELVGSIASAGFHNILLLNSHGGNASALDIVLTKCKMAFPSYRFVCVTYWNAAASALRPLRESNLGGMGHACELETSLVWTERPDLVRKDLLFPDGRWPASRFFGKDMLQGGTASIALTFDEISEHGAVGDPRTANPEKGERFFEAIIQALVELVQQMQTSEIANGVPVAKNG